MFWRWPVFHVYYIVFLWVVGYLTIFITKRISFKLRKICFLFRTFINLMESAFDTNSLFTMAAAENWISLAHFILVLLSLATFFHLGFLGNMYKLTPSCVCIAAAMQFFPRQLPFTYMHLRPRHQHVPP